MRERPGDARLGQQRQGGYRPNSIRPCGLPEAVGSDNVGVNDEVMSWKRPDLRSWALSGYLWLICYRYRDSDARLPLKSVTESDIRGKATTSVSTSAVFLGFVVAVLVGFSVLDVSKVGRVKALDLGNVLEVVGGILLPYTVIWIERQISYVRLKSRGTVPSNEDSDDPERDEPGDGKAVEGEALWYIGLVIGALAYLLLLWLLYPVPEDLTLAGVSLLSLSAFFLFAALEFYDTAAGWTGGTRTHFHLERIGSHSYALGVSLALVGAACSFTAIQDVFGRVAAAAALLVVIGTVETERQVRSSGL